MNKNSTKKFEFNQKNIAIIITAAVLLLVIIATSIFLIVDAVNQDKGFDYFESDLSKYVEIDEDDYKNYKISIDYAKPKDIDIDIALLSLVAADKGAAVDNGVFSSKYTVYPGDVVQIWYRGYIFDEEGNPVEVDGMSNMKNAKPTEITIGEGAFVPGFELGLVGKCSDDYTRFEKITDGVVEEDQVIYVTYTRMPVGGDEKKDKETASYVRIDLSDPDVDEKFGKGFKSTMLAGIRIGTGLDFKAEIDGKVYNYTNTTVKFATECEKSENVIKVECYFPYNYGTDGTASANLRNENAVFEVYIDFVKHYELAEGVLWDEENSTYVITDDYIRGKLSEEGSLVTEEELAEYEGDTLLEKYKSYAESFLEESYEETYRELVEEAIWAHLNKVANIKKYPKSMVEPIYDEYVDDVYYQFSETGGSLTDSYGVTTTYDDIDEFATAYLSLTYSKLTWKEYLYSLAESLVGERLILYYLLSEIDGLMPDEQTLTEKKESIKAEYIEEYIKQYLEYEEKTEADFTPEEYEQYVSDRTKEILAYYDDDHFTETAYYEIAFDTLVTYPEVSTLDDRRDFPFDK